MRVPLYHRNENSEKISGLRGMTYNLMNGQLVKTKLDGGTNFTEELTPNVRVRKFTLPGVREGSVIEYAYTVTSDFYFNFQDWTFQHDIPVRWSEFRANIPEYFKYKRLLQGYHALAVQTQGENIVPFTEHTAGGFSGNGVTTTREAAHSDVVMARVTNYRWVMKDVPAFRDEPYMTTAADYVDRFSFQLAGLQFPGEGYQSVADTWSKLLGDEDFGLQMNRGNFLKDQVHPLAVKYPDAAARAAAVREMW